MEDITRRNTIKTLATAAILSAMPSCKHLAGRESNCANYVFNQLHNPVIDMHAHFFNATDLLAVEYVLGPATNDFVGDRFKHTRRLLARVGNAILGLNRRNREIRAINELAWLNGSESCSPIDEYTQVSREFFEFVSAEDANQSTKVLGTPINTTFETTLNSAAAELGGGFQDSEKRLFSRSSNVQFDPKTVLNAVAGYSVYEQQADVRSFQFNGVCPRDPGFLSRVLAFVGRALVRRSTNIQAYYDRYSLRPIDGYGVRHVLNIGCDFDFFLSDDCNNRRSNQG
ncbi:MAG: hypothetical protein GKR90_14175 [Pseudomonadales bacterium]|nr:hypothetical protein [Pseudomonadales bacterium]